MNLSYFGVWFNWKLHILMISDEWFMICEKLVFFQSLFSGGNSVKWFNCRRVKIWNEWDCFYYFWIDDSNILHLKSKSTNIHWEWICSIVVYPQLWQKNSFALLQILHFLFTSSVTPHFLHESIRMLWLVLFDTLYLVSWLAYLSFEQFTILYHILQYTIVMKTQTTQISTWDKMVHAPFKKVVIFDLICMGLGIMMGIGIGVYLVAGV